MNTGDAVRKRRPPHRGANGCTVEFATDFVRKRLEGFAKDMKICLTGVPRPDDETRETHAYFPALMSCFSTLDYLTQLHLGRPKIGYKEVAEYAKKYMTDEYDADTVRVLFEAFRNKIAHRGIASGVWIDHHKKRRITWRVEEHGEGPALAVVEEAGVLVSDPPWRTPYTHRMLIHLDRFGDDILDSSEKYLAELATSADLLENFKACMRHLYPT